MQRTHGIIATVQTNVPLYTEFIQHIAMQRFSMVGANGARCCFRCFFCLFDDNKKNRSFKCLPLLSSCMCGYRMDTYHVSNIPPSREPCTERQRIESERKNWIMCCDTTSNDRNLFSFWMEKCCVLYAAVLNYVALRAKCE